MTVKFSSTGQLRSVSVTGCAVECEVLAQIRIAMQRLFRVTSFYRKCGTLNLVAAAQEPISQQISHQLDLPHSCPSWLGRGWASPSAAHVLGLAHLLADVCPIRHAQAMNWACHCWSMPKHMIGQGQSGMPKQEHGQALARGQCLGLPKQCPRIISA